MVTLTRRKKNDGGAFTLLELLLTVALLMALLAAVVFNFQSAQQGADLDEGARQFEALIRFAGAQAANSGKAVQFRFGDDAAFGLPSGTSSSATASATSANAATNSVKDLASIGDLEDWGAKLRVVYEADPVLQPGVFVDLPEAATLLEEIGNRVRIEKVQMPERPLNQGTNDLAVAQDTPATATSVTFYPDGSSETADIFLVSKAREDFRELIVHLDGVTGRIRHEFKSGDDLVPVEWMEDENSSLHNQASMPGTAAPDSSPEKSPTTETAPMPEDPAFVQPDSTKSETSKTNAFDDFP
jgi:type II secretory pathway pseudopilin PulG